MAGEDQQVVYLGNRNAVEVHDDPNDIDAALREQRAPGKVRVALPGRLCTTVKVAPGLSLLEAAHHISSAQGLWPHHSDDEKPAWVASTWPALGAVLAEHWGIELREPQPIDQQAQAALDALDEVARGKLPPSPSGAAVDEPADAEPTSAEG